MRDNHSRRFCPECEKVMTFENMDARVFASNIIVKEPETQQKD